MTNASIHFQQNDEVRTVVNASSKVKWVFQVDPSTNNEYPGKTMVGRKYVKNEGDYINQGAAGADRWWADFGAYVDARPYIEYWVACNEPQGDWPTIAAYQKRWADLAHARGRKAVVGNFSIGTPEPEDAPIFKDMVAAGDCVAFHEYWMPQHWDELNKWQGWVMWRYKKFMDNLPTHLRQKPVLITECGCDGGTKATLGQTPDRKGWLTHYNANEDWYMEDLTAYVDGLDDRVKAIFMYTAGPYSEWADFKVTPSLAGRFLNLTTEAAPVPTPQPEQPTLRVKKPNGSIVVMNVEDYVKGVVPMEVPSWWPSAALRAQAIAARSYALASRNGKHAAQGFDVCSTTCCQVYSDARYVNTTQAVEDTRGIVGVHNGSVAHTFFSASCGGKLLGNWASYLRARTDCPCAEHGFGINGHQNGMCQEGAYYQALDGKTWQEILDFYYDLTWVREYGLGEEFPSTLVPVTSELETRLREVEIALANLQQRLEGFEEQDALGYKVLAK